MRNENKFNANNGIISLVYCFDDNIVDYVKVSICSLLVNKKESTHYRICGICTEAAYTYRQELEELVNAIDSCSYIDIKCCTNNYDTGYEIRNITKATYFRFEIADVFVDVDKIIYIDVDTVVLKDLTELWNIELDRNFIMGVRDSLNIYLDWENKKSRFKYWEKFDDWRGNYINAGVMLINLKMIRDKKMSEIWREKISQHYYYQDQDIINLTCKPFIGCLPFKYNYMTYYTFHKLEELVKDNVYNLKEVETGIDDPYIIHYAGQKPWNDICVNKADIWWKYAKSKHLGNRFYALFEKMKEIKVSLIITVSDNQYEYLDSCLESINRQRIKGIEIICVVSEIGDSYKLENIKAYEKEIKWLSIREIDKYSIAAARSEGVRCARGEYICFLEANYKLKQSCLRNAIFFLEKNDLDCLVFSIDIKTNNSTIEMNIGLKKDLLEPETGVKAMFIQILNDEIYPFAGLHFIRRKILNDNYFLFHRMIGFDDEFFLYRLLYLCQRVMCVCELGATLIEECYGNIEENVRLENILALWKNLIRLIKFNKDKEYLDDTEKYVDKHMTKLLKNRFINEYNLLNEGEKKKFRDFINYYETVLLDCFVL